MFHKILQLEFHRMIVKGLEPRFLGREPHTNVALVDLLELLLVVRASWSASNASGSRFATLESFRVEVSFE